MNTPHPTKVLLYLENNQKYLNGNHIIVALKSFFKIYKQLSSEKSKNEANNWTKQTTFQELCTFIKSNINKLSGPQAIDVLDVLTRMKIDTSSIITRSVLKYILQVMNELSVEDFKLLSSVVQRLPPTYLVRQVKLISSQKCVLKLPSALESEEIGPLSNALYFLAINIRNRNLLEQVLDKLHNYKKEITLTIAIDIMESICNLNYSSTKTFDVFFKAQNKILENLEKLSQSQINYILRLITDKLKASR